MGCGVWGGGGEGGREVRGRGSGEGVWPPLCMCYSTEQVCLWACGSSRGMLLYTGLTRRVYRGMWAACGGNVGPCGGRVGAC